MTIKSLLKDGAMILRGQARLVRHRRAIERQSEEWRRTRVASSTNYFSQVGQDQFLDQQIFHGRRGGVFVDIGAFDGVEFSNTCYLERGLGWTGLCVEPNPAVFARLIQNRQCKCVNVGVSDTGGVAMLVQFPDAEMFTGLARSVLSANRSRKERLEVSSRRRQEVEVQCVEPNRLFREQALQHIDYLSIDAEGMDFAILKAIDLQAFDIDVISIENNAFAFGYDLMAFLDARGYDLVGVVGDEIYRRRRGNPAGLG
jgi:FkbM family methyltransferase